MEVSECMDEIRDAAYEFALFLDDEKFMKYLMEENPTLMGPYFVSLFESARDDENKRNAAVERLSYYFVLMINCGNEERREYLEKCLCLAMNNYDEIVDLYHCYKRIIILKDNDEITVEKIQEITEGVTGAENWINLI